MPLRGSAATRLSTADELADQLLRLAHNWQAQHQWDPAPAAPTGPALLRQLLGLREWLGLFDEWLRDEVAFTVPGTRRLLTEQYALLHRTARRWHLHLRLQTLRQQRHDAIRGGEQGRARELQREEMICLERLRRLGGEGKSG